MTGARVCEACGHSLDGTRAGKATCEGKCRTAAWRQRKKLREGDAPPSPPVTVTGPPVTVTEALAAGPCPTDDALSAEIELARLREKFGEDFR